MTAADPERDAYRQRLDIFMESREAGGRLTRESLRTGITLHAVVVAAATVADYADEAQAIVREAYDPHLDCRAGCWYCCSKPNVLATVPELVRIVHHVDTTFSDDDRAALKARAARYADQMRGRRVEDPLNESVPCPMLVDGNCSAYEVRPLICRGYNSTDVDACRRAHEHADALVPTFAMLADVTDGARVGAAQRLAELSVDDALVDLGTALDIVLSSPSGTATAVVDGTVDLSAARNRSWVPELWARVRETAEWVATR